MKKKFMCLIVSALLCMSTAFATGCGAKDKDQDKTVTLTVYSQLANSDGEQSGFFSTILKDKFNINLIIIRDSAGVYASRMEAKDLGDIIVWSNNGEQYQNAVSQGLLFDWEDEDLLDNYGKDIKKYFSIGLEANRGITNLIEGLDNKYKNKIFGIGNKLCQNLGDHEEFFYNWDIRWDLYKQLEDKYPVINNLDDYADLLKDMHELEPYGEDGNPTYAYSFWKDWDDKMVMNVKAFATSYWGYDELGVGLYDTDTGTYHDALEEGGPYLEALKFFNKLYREDLIDPDSMSQTFNEVSTKLNNGRNHASMFNYTGYMVYNTDARLESGKMMATLVPKEAKPPVYALNPNGGTNIWSIGAKTRYPEKCMELLNWLATPEGSMYIFNGIQGVHWDYDDEGGIYYTEFGEKSIKDKTTLQDGVVWTSPWTGKKYTLNGRFSDGELQTNNTFWVRDAVNLDSRKGERFSENSWASFSSSLDKYPIAQDWKTFTGRENRQDYLEKRVDAEGNPAYIIVPPFDYLESRKDATLSKKWNQVIDNIKSYTWQALYAKSDNAFNMYVNEMRREANSHGYADCVAWSISEAHKKFPSTVK